MYYLYLLCFSDQDTTSTWVWCHANSWLWLCCTEHINANPLDHHIGLVCFSRTATIRLVGQKLIYYFFDNQVIILIIFQAKISKTFAGCSFLDVNICCCSFSKWGVFVCWTDDWTKEAVWWHHFGLQKIVMSIFTFFISD